MLSSSVLETIQFGAKFASGLNPGDVVCLKGDLGAGKTHFVKGIASFFGVKTEQVQSPTFTLINEYSGTLPIYHFDCYRLKNEREALEIGAEEYFYGEGISVVEWPQKVGNLLPPECVWVTITHVGEHQRNIEIASDQ
ncbi:MAG: tRNA (adenosine(37)-N6)-threonylcarbamoyltransferase complex ATPase subunit type 1 TsaE [Balneolales bacterium]|nr:tRNA (adenosine(37)-N6)-threonylcarbamoyltransferase complex ATPase subunit type 1 TsaE [Balneolales bacterium]